MSAMRGSTPGLNGTKAAAPQDERIEHDVRQSPLLEIGGRQDHEGDEQQQVGRGGPPRQRGAGDDRGGRGPAGARQQRSCAARSDGEHASSAGHTLASRSAAAPRAAKTMPTAIETHSMFTRALGLSGPGSTRHAVRGGTAHRTWRASRVP